MMPKIQGMNVRKITLTQPVFRFKQDFVQLGILGQGDFGEVFKVKSRIDGLTYAIKRTRHPLNGSRQE